MKLPRNLSGEELVAALAKFGYIKTRQTGSHIRLTNQLKGEHHITIPNHSPIKVGTLNNILKEVAEYLHITKDELIQQIF
jgi:predicted RNA binding protein YcfA (HicA-like mRNA interferase family)